MPKSAKRFFENLQAWVKEFRRTDKNCTCQTCQILRVDLAAAEQVLAMRRDRDCKDWDARQWQEELDSRVRYRTFLTRNSLVN